MIALHRLTHPNEPLYLNPDLIQTVEAHPDTVISLTTNAKLVVSDSVEEVVTRIREWRASILVVALTSPAAGSRKETVKALGQVVQMPTRAPLPQER